MENNIPEVATNVVAPEAVEQAPVVPPAVNPELVQALATQIAQATVAAAAELPQQTEEIVSTEVEGNTLTQTIAVSQAPAEPEATPTEEKPEVVVKPVQNNKKPNKVAPNKAVGKDGKKKMTPEERQEGWKTLLRDKGGYDDELTIKSIAEYAFSHRGYNQNKFWGAVLIRMFNRMSQRLTNRLETFTADDAEWLQKQLIRFVTDKPWGNGPKQWNSTYQSSMDQKIELEKYFCISGPYHKLGRSEMILAQIRDAAWPSYEEEERLIGGSFAERFHYLVGAIVAMTTTSSELADGLFKHCYHTQKPDEILKREQERAAKMRSRLPDWVGKDGKCKECGADTMKDEDGNLICSNPLCAHNIPVTNDDTPESFSNVPRRDAQKPYRPRMEFAPSGDNNKGGKRDWKGGKDRRHNRDNDDDEAFQGKKFKKHGKRFHENEDEEPVEHINSGMPEGVTVCSTPGGENFGSLSGLFDGIAIQK